MSLLENTETQPQPQLQPETLVEAPPTLCYDVVIVGGGVAGLSAGVYTARDGFKTLILEGTMLSSVDYPGGALMLTPEIQNFPGFDGEGAALIDSIRTQAETFGCEIREERAQTIDFSSKQGGLHVVHTDETFYRAKTVILATGAVAKQLGVTGEDKFLGRGVSTCATCDGFFFKDKAVAVVGGGDTAVEDALFLTRYAEKVYLLPRKNDLRAQGPDAREVREHPQIEILWSSTVEEVVGEDKVDGIIYNRLGELKDLPVDGVFVAIGRYPSTTFLVGTELADRIDAEGYLMTESGTTTVSHSIPGVFAAGDAVDKVFRQAITSAGKAVEAALEARHYLLTVRRENS